MRSRVVAAIIAIVSLIVPAVVPPQPAYADAPVIKTTLAITGTTTPVVVRNLTDQSSCTIEINGTATGTVQGIEQGVTVNVKAVQIPDGGTPSTTITGPGQFTANCAGMQVFQFTPTAVTGTATITVIASGAVGRIIGAGVNGGVTNVVGSGPVTVTNSGNTATVGLTDPLPILYGGTGATAIPTGCLQSNGTQITSTGVACGSGSGTVTAVTGTGNINVTAGATPVVSITNAPTFTGTVTGGSLVSTGQATFQSLVDLSSFASNRCLDTNGVSYLVVLPVDCPFDSSSSFTIPAVGSTVSVTLSHPAFPQNQTPVFITDGTNSMTGLITAGANTTTITVKNTGLISGSVGGTMAAGEIATGGAGGLVSGVTSVSGTGNIAVTTGPTPAVSITNSPTFTGTATVGTLLTTNIGASGISNPRCLRNLNPYFVGTTVDCPFGTTTASFVIPAVGSTVSVATGNSLMFPNTNQPITISDGTNTMDGLVTVVGATMTVQNLGMGAGSVGNTMASGAELLPGNGIVPGTVTSVSGTGNITSTGGTTPVIAITAAPSFSSITDTGLTPARCVLSSGASALGSALQACPVNNTTVSFVIPAVGSSVSVTVGSSYFLAKNNTPIVITDGTNLMDGLVTAGQGTATLTVTNTGVPTGAVGNTMASGAYMAVGGTGATNGTLTGITAGNDIVVGTGPTPSVAVTNSPVFTGNTFIGTSGSYGDSGAGLGGIEIGSGGTGGYSQLSTYNNSANFVNSIGGQLLGIGLTNSSPKVTVDTSGDVSSAGSFYSGAVTSGNCLQGSTNGQIASTSNACGTVTSVSGTGNITSTGGTTPIVAITAAPTFTNVTVSGLTGARCMVTSGGSQLGSAQQACPVDNTTASFVIPAMGSSVSVTVGSIYFLAKNNTPIVITDGTNTMNGLVTAGEGTLTLTVTNTGVITGAIGNTMATAAYVAVGAGLISFSGQGGTRLNATHIETTAAAGIAVGASSTATFTYGTAFNAAPSCTVSNIGAVAPSLSINATPGTASVVVYNSSTSAVTASVSCVGW